MGRQKAVARMHIAGAVDNKNKSERKSLRRRSDLMDSEHVVVDMGESVEVADTNTKNILDAMDYVGDTIVAM